MPLSAFSKSSIMPAELATAGTFKVKPVGLGIEVAVEGRGEPGILKYWPMVSPRRRRQHHRV